MHLAPDLTSAYPFRCTCGAGPCPTTNLCQGGIQRRVERTETTLSCWRKTLQDNDQSFRPSWELWTHTEPSSAEVPQHQCKSENGVTSCSQLCRQPALFYFQTPTSFRPRNRKMCRFFFFSFFPKLPLNSVSTKRDKGATDKATDALNDGLDRIHPAIVWSLTLTSNKNCKAG